MGTTDTKKSWTYDDFEQSQSTTDANKNRQDVNAQKPGEFTYNAYEKSDSVKQAEDILDQHMANKPGEYSSKWQSYLDDQVYKIMNREKFSYDLNGDALYQQYKDQYTLQGQQAMMDTMGQAAAMTGGYGNSYAQTVGQQTYQGYLQQLNDKIPELYQLALDQYNREGDEMYKMYGLFADREDQDYGRYRDDVSDWRDDRDYYTTESRYQSEQDYNRYIDGRDFAYGQHRDSVSDWQYDMNRSDNEYWNQYNADYNTYSDNRNMSYQQYRDSVSDDQWNQSFQYQQGRDDKADQQWQQTFDEGVRQFNVSQGNKTSSSSSGSSNSGTQYKSLDVGSNAYNTMMADMDTVDSVEDLYDLAKRYIALGYDPDQVNAMTSAKARELQGKNTQKNPQLPNGARPYTEFFTIN